MKKQKYRRSQSIHQKGRRIWTKKRLGQHFLINAGVIAHILAALEAKEGDHFLEIGPGPGTLTEPLNRLGFSFPVVEFDGDMVTLLRSKSFDPPIRIIHGDFMDVPLDEVIVPGIKVFSNLPYNLSVPITARLLRAAPHIPLMVMMYQKEVAVRIRANQDSRDYGPISVLVKAFYDIDLHFNVAPGSFRPPPKVNSQVLRFRLKERPLLSSGLELERMTVLLRFLFNHRRKTLGWSLKRWTGDWTDHTSLLESLIACGLDPKSRPEHIGPEDYVHWLHSIKEHHDRT